MMLLTVAGVLGAVLLFIVIFCCLVSMRLRRVRADCNDRLARGEPVYNIPPNDGCLWACKAIICCGCCRQDPNENPFGATLRAEEELAGLLPPTEENYHRRKNGRPSSKMSIRSAPARANNNSHRTSRNHRKRSYPTNHQSITDIPAGIVRSSLLNAGNRSQNRRSSSSNVINTNGDVRNRRRSSSVCPPKSQNYYNGNWNNEGDLKQQSTNFLSTKHRYKTTRDIGSYSDRNDSGHFGKRKSEYSSARKVAEYLKQVETPQSESCTDSSAEVEPPRSNRKSRSQTRYRRNVAQCQPSPTLTDLLAKKLKSRRRAIAPEDESEQDFSADDEGLRYSKGSYRRSTNSHNNTDQRKNAEQPQPVINLVPYSVPQHQSFCCNPTGLPYTNGYNAIPNTHNVNRNASFPCDAFTHTNAYSNQNTVTQQTNTPSVVPRTMCNASFEQHPPVPQITGTPSTLNTYQCHSVQPNQQFPTANHSYLPQSYNPTTSIMQTFPPPERFSNPNTILS